MHHIIGFTAVAMKRLRDRRILKAVSRQRLSKHVSAAMDMSTIEELCFLCCSCQDVINKGQSEKRVQFCMGGCEERT